MTTKKISDVKSVSLDQINKLEGGTVVGGGTQGTQSASTESKRAGDLAKMEDAIDKTFDGRSTRRDGKSYDKDQEKREADGPAPTTGSTPGDT